MFEVCQLGEPNPPPLALRARCILARTHHRWRGAAPFSACSRGRPSPRKAHDLRPRTMLFDFATYAVRSAPLARHPAPITRDYPLHVNTLAPAPPPAYRPGARAAWLRCAGARWRRSSLPSTTPWRVPPVAPARSGCRRLAAHCSPPARLSCCSHYQPSHV